MQENCIDVTATLESAEFGVGGIQLGYTSPLLELEFGFAYERGTYETDPAHPTSFRCLDPIAGRTLCPFKASHRMNDTDAADLANAEVDEGDSVSWSSSNSINMHIDDNTSTLTFVVSRTQGMSSTVIVAVPVLPGGTAIDTETLNQLLNA